MQRGVQVSGYDSSQYWRLEELKAGWDMQERGCLEGEKSDIDIKARRFDEVPFGLTEQIIDI